MPPLEFLITCTIFMENDRDPQNYIIMENETIKGTRRDYQSNEEFMSLCY